MSAWPDHKGKPGTFIDIDGNHVTTTILDEIIEPQGSEKLVYLQLIRFPDDHLEYRFTYYVRARKGPHKGVAWVFGRNSLVVPPAELKVILEKARTEKHWEGF